MGSVFKSYSVVIDPVVYSCDKESNILAKCQEILRQILRHVDGVENVVVRGSSPVCEHCGHPWTESSSAYNGGCCDKDEENAPISNREK